MMAIADAAREAGLTPGTLRLYQRLGFINPQRDSTGRRLFTASDVALAKRISVERRAARALAMHRGRREAMA